MKSITWKIFAAAALVLVGAVGAEAQDPLPATDVTADAIDEFIDALPDDAISDRPIRVVDVGGYHVGVYGVFRPGDVPGDAILHEVVRSEVYYMLEGGGTLVTGGTLIDPRRSSPESTSLRGDGIRGGDSRRIEAGDVVIIPGGTPHWWSEMDGDIRYLIIRPDPEGSLTLQ